MVNSEVFLNYFNEIDQHLKKAGDYSTSVSFVEKVRSSSNKAVIRYKDELISLAELRNAIVHNPRIGNRAIAEPHDIVVKRIKELHEYITQPTKVLPEFQKEVMGALEEDFINDILKKMREHSFSQFPVFDNEGFVKEVVSTNTISRWLSSQLEREGSILVEDVRVKAFMDEIEFHDNFKFLARNASIYDAYELFIKHINICKRNLDVLFITSSGKREEKLLGLITIEDIALKVMY